MQTKRRIVFWLLAAACLLLLTGCGRNEPTVAVDTSNGPTGTSIPDSTVGTKRITAPDPDDDLNGPVYTELPYILEDDDPLAPEIKAALAAKEAKLIWAKNCFSETSHEVKYRRFTFIDCNELYKELLKELFPDATLEKREDSLDGLRLEMRSGEISFVCMVDINGVYVSLDWLPSGLSETLLPKAADWLAKKTGVEQREWADFDPTLTIALKQYTACVDGIQVGALYHNRVLTDIIDCHGVKSTLDSLGLFLPISVGEEAGTVKICDSFTQEELRNTLEFSFDPNGSAIVVYRSCELCYMIDEARSLLVPVWWVKGVNFSTDTGEGKPFEIIYDVETGSKYRT